jgi:hypothetical protein
MPVVDLPDDELRALIAAIRGVIEGDKYPRAPRLDPLRAALARLVAAAEPTPRPKAPPAGRGDKGARRKTRGQPVEA